MSILKTYKSATTIGISILLSNGKPRRISFDPLYSGASSYTTDNEEIQKALEKDSRFNKLFWIDRTADTENETEDLPAESSPEEEKTATTVHVNSLSEAREYLATTFEIQRSNVRTREAISKVAEAHNIVFSGIDL